MAFLCRDLFRMKTLKSLEIVAGEGGLYKKVTWIYIGDNTNVAEWGRGGEVMFITGIGMDRSEQGIYKVVADSIDRNLSAIVISRNEKYINDIPESVKELADKNDFPLFFIPWAVKRIDVSKEIAEEIIGNQQNEHSENELVYLLKKKELSYEDQERIRYLLKPYNVDSTLKFTVLSFEAVDKMAVRIEKLLFCIRREMSEKAIGGRIILLSDEKRVYLIYYRQHKIGSDEAKELAESILKGIEKDCGTIAVGICTGKRKESEAIKAAIRSIKIYTRINSGESISDRDRVTIYDNLGLLRIVYENIKHPEMREYYKDVIHKLIEYDENVENYMLDTIIAYFENMYNISKTAEALYIHRNTLIYRLNKIEELTGKSMKDPYLVTDMVFSAIAFKYMNQPL